MFKTSVQDSHFETMLDSL